MLFTFSALGISNEVEMYGLKGSKKKKSKKFDEDYVVRVNLGFSLVYSLNLSLSGSLFSSLYLRMTFRRLFRLFDKLKVERSSSTLDAYKNYGRSVCSTTNYAIAWIQSDMYHPRRPRR